MRSMLFFSLTLLFGLITQAQYRDFCNGPFHDEEVCNRMKHLRSTINSMDAQRELLQINYNYMTVLAGDLKKNSAEILKVMKEDNRSHRDGILQVEKMAMDLERSANEKNSETFVTANLIRNTCVSCHSSATPPSGIKWSDVFSYDWAKTSQACNAPGKNPYLCRNMNGLLTAYSQILTSYVAGIEDYELLEGAATEILRIIHELGSNNFFHFNEAIRSEAEAKAVEIEALARLRDPMVFEKSQALPVTCMKCHSSMASHTFGKLEHKIW